MTKWKRAQYIFTALIMLAMSAVLAIDPRHGFYAILTLLGLSLLIRGIRTLVYYFTMARHMISGQAILYAGVILIDLSLVTLSVSRIPLAYLVLYLLGAYALYGGIDILRALEAKRLEAGSWKLNLTTGIVNLLVAACSLVFGLILKETSVVVDIYAAGLAYSAVIKIITAFRRSAVVYIQ